MDSHVLSFQKWIEGCVRCGRYDASVRSCFSFNLRNISASNNQAATRQLEFCRRNHTWVQVYRGSYTSNIFISHYGKMEEKLIIDVFWIKVWGHRETQVSEMNLRRMCQRHWTNMVRLHWSVARKWAGSSRGYSSCVAKRVGMNPSHEAVVVEVSQITEPAQFSWYRKMLFFVLLSKAIFTSPLLTDLTRFHEWPGVWDCEMIFLCRVAGLSSAGKVRGFLI